MSDMGSDRNTVKVRMSWKGAVPITGKRGGGEGEGFLLYLLCCLSCFVSLGLLVAVVFLDLGLGVPSGGSRLLSAAGVLIFSLLFRERHVLAPTWEGRRAETGGTREPFFRTTLQLAYIS